MHESDRTLRLGPLLRYVDESRATVWVETDRPCEVEILGHRERTWTVHGHHYALVLVEGLTPGSETPYEVALDGRTVWPSLPGFGPSVIRTPATDGSFRLAFGSCRRSAPFDDEGWRQFGPDALVALAERMAARPRSEWPDALLLLGDQVYADDPSDAVLARLREARDEQVGRLNDEIGDFEEYTWLYDDAWTQPAVRWLFSTVPLCMLLDDHDLRDDWNTSLSWRRWVTAQPWWRDRVVGAYASYWVYQHLGNLTPEQLAKDPTYAAAMRNTAHDSVRSAYLDDFAWRADTDPASARWSFYRDIGSVSRGIRLMAIDSRCSRHLEPEERAMVDATEWAWVRKHTVGAGHPVRHLLLASTLPFLLAPGLHHLEGWNEAISRGAWGRRAAAFGERLRQAMDLEHWSSFRASFDAAVQLLTDIAGLPDPPRTVAMLSGDVHCSYLAEAKLRGVDHDETSIQQLTMSPFRNPVGRQIRRAIRLLDTAPMTAALHRLARLARVGDVAIDWRIDQGPWFGNGVMTLLIDDSTVEVEVEHAHLEAGQEKLRSTCRRTVTQ